jgi:hypothetical protein
MQNIHILLTFLISVQVLQCRAFLGTSGPPEGEDSPGLRVGTR